MNLRMLRASATSEYSQEKYFDMPGSNQAFVNELERENGELKRANKILREFATFLAQENSEKK